MCIVFRRVRLYVGWSSRSGSSSEKATAVIRRMGSIQEDSFSWVTLATSVRQVSKMGKGGMVSGRRVHIIGGQTAPLSRDGVPESHRFGKKQEIGCMLSWDGVRWDCSSGFRTRVMFRPWGREGRKGKREARFFFAEHLLNGRLFFSL